MYLAKYNLFNYFKIIIIIITKIIELKIKVSMLLDYIKKIRSNILFNNLTHFYLDRYITYKNINNKFFKKKKIFKKGDYIYYLYKELHKYNIKDRLLKKIFIQLHIIIHELSADCAQRKISINIENYITKLNLKILIKILKETLPSGLNVALKEKNNNILLLNKFKNLNGTYKIFITTKKKIKRNENLFYNIIIDFKKKKLLNTHKTELKKNTKTIEGNEHINYEKNYHLIKGNNNDIKSYTKIPFLSYDEYKIKKEKFFVCKYKHIFSDDYFNIKNQNKIYFNKKNYNKILSINNAIISFRGLISFNQYVIQESIKHSIWDPVFKIENNKILIPKITKIINENAIIFPTAYGSLGHYIFESIIRLYYLKKIKEYKIIVYETIPKYLIEILLNLGLKKKQILFKKLNESWKIKKLLFPIIPLFEVSKKEKNFLGNLVEINNKKKIKIFNSCNYEKIYISRCDARENRNLINEKEIEELLISSGFKIIIASQLTLIEKIKIFSNAKIIISPLGSAVHNFIFCKKISAKVLFIGTRKYFVRDYAQYAFLMKLKLYFIEATEIPSFNLGWHYNHSSFFLNPIILKKTLNIL